MGDLSAVSPAEVEGKVDDKMLPLNGSVTVWAAIVLRFLLQCLKSLVSKPQIKPHL